MSNFKDALIGKIDKMKDSKKSTGKKTLSKPRAATRTEAKLNNLASKHASREVEDFPSSDFVNEMIKDGNSVYANEGRIISGNLEISEELIYLNASKIKSGATSGENLEVTISGETQTAIVSANAITDAPAYRITVTKNKELTGGRIGIKFVGETDDDKTAISNNAQVEFEKDSEVVEIVIIPTITDLNGITVPVMFHADPTAGSGTGHYIQITGVATGMKVTVDVVSKLDLLALN